MKQTEGDFRILKYYFDLLLTKVGITDPDCRAEINDALDAIEEAIEEQDRPALDHFPAPELHQAVYVPERLETIRKTRKHHRPFGIDLGVYDTDLKCPDCGQSNQQAMIDATQVSGVMEVPSTIQIVCWCPCGCIYVADSDSEQFVRKLYSFFDHKAQEGRSWFIKDPHYITPDQHEPEPTPTSLYDEEELCPDLDELRDYVFEPIEPGEEP